ncbi:uncharacterized protein DNG_06751 [Cephalotrichum gorgonifer]|uniref:Uncharacterized protein n=1 Tax=Cephalotrichum gorgonifer TaxID=2041049 RepID=A0AAE8N281_9PEZI|nr:uncharacterized protein DNG_06751 [Cephalotrichum gorgonifer]
MAADMERPILASYMATMNVFTDTLLFDRKTDYESVVTGPDGLPKDGAGDFVVSDSYVQTFSQTGIATLGGIFGTLLVANAVISLLLALKKNSNSGTWKLFHD